MPAHTIRRISRLRHVVAVDRHGSYFASGGDNGPQPVSAEPQRPNPRGGPGGHGDTRLYTMSNASFAAPYA